jgi:hypothetical protein
VHHLLVFDLDCPVENPDELERVLPTSLKELRPNSYVVIKLTRFFENGNRKLSSFKIASMMESPRTPGSRKTAVSMIDHDT